MSEVAGERSPAAEPLGSVVLWSEFAGALCGSAGAPDAEPESAEPLWPASVAAPASWEAGVVSCGGVATGVPADPPVSAPWLALSAEATLSPPDPRVSAALVAVSLPDPPVSVAGAPLSLVEAGAADGSWAGAVLCESVAELCDSPAAGAEACESAVELCDSPAAGAGVCWSAVAVASRSLDREVPATPLAAAAAPEPRRWRCDLRWWPAPRADCAFQLPACAFQLACALCPRPLPPALAPPALALPEPAVELPAAEPPVVVTLPWSEVVLPPWSDAAVAPWSDVPEVPEAAVAVSLGEESAVAESAAPEF